LETWELGDKLVWPPCLWLYEPCDHKMALKTRSATKATSAVAYDLIGAASEVASAEYVTTVAFTNSVGILCHGPVRNRFSAYDKGIQSRQVGVE
jgi:hypothetical protein